MNCDALDMGWRTCLEEGQIGVYPSFIAVAHNQVECKSFFLQFPALPI